MTESPERLPRPNAAFEWTSGPTPTLVCRPLEPFAIHAFTTRRWRLGATAEGDAGRWEEVARAVGVDALHLRRVRQVHGASVVIHRPGLAFEPSTAADAIATSDPESAVAVQTADCVPLLLVDTRTGVVAAAHAGWRGLAQRAPIVTVETLEGEFGSRASKLLAAIGPAIGPCCYEVGGEVRDRFADAGFSAWDLARWFSSDAVFLPDNPSLAPRQSADKGPRWFLDLWTAARDQLRAAGVREDRIFSADLCTASHPDVFCSFRRDGPRAGRTAAVVRARRAAV